MQVEPIKPMLKAPGIELLQQVRGIAVKFCFQIQVALLQQGGVQSDRRRGVRGGGRGPGDGADRVQGRTVQVDPIKPVLKPPGTQRSKLDFDGLLSSFPYKFSLRRYSTGLTTRSLRLVQVTNPCAPTGPILECDADTAAVNTECGQGLAPFHSPSCH